jgi:hypothetical protein
MPSREMIPPECATRLAAFGATAQGMASAGRRGRTEPARRRRYKAARRDCPRGMASAGRRGSKSPAGSQRYKTGSTRLAALGATAEGMASARGARQKIAGWEPFDCAHGKPALQKRLDAIVRGEWHGIRSATARKARGRRRGYDAFAVSKPGAGRPTARRTRRARALIKRGESFRAGMR